MMFGTRGEFDYDECANCGSLQIAAIPDDATIAAAYPSDYYSFSPRRGSPGYRHGIVRRLSDRLVFSPLPRLRRSIPTPVDILREAGVKKSASVIDVGCGSGKFLDRLKHIGFTSLCGADPFLDADGSTEAGVPLFKGSLAEVQGPFDVIMFNHSLEHVPSPAETLRDARAKLNSGGLCITRVPTPSSDVFARYGASWAQIDAPRHMTLISRPGMSALAAAAGFELRATIDDQRPWSLMASESCAKDIPWKNLSEQSAPAALARLSAQANAAGRGDQVAFILRAKPL
jgi:SAM-dependent methyltransferase